MRYNTVEFRGNTYNVRFRHHRYRDEDGNILQNGGETVANIYIEDDNLFEEVQQRIADIATKHNPGDLYSSQHFSQFVVGDNNRVYASAMCSDKDQYSKKHGNRIAHGRLQKILNLLE